METTGCEPQVFALALKLNGDVTLVPSRGAETEIPDVNFAVTDAGGIEHPVTTIGTSRAVRAKIVRAFKNSSEYSEFSAIDRAPAFGLNVPGHSDIRTLPNLHVQDGIRAPISS